MVNCSFNRFVFSLQTKKLETKAMLLLSLKQRQCPIAHLVAWLPPYLGCGFEHGHNQNSLFTTNERISTSGRN